MHANIHVERPEDEWTNCNEMWRIFATEVLVVSMTLQIFAWRLKTLTLPHSPSTVSHPHHRSHRFAVSRLWRKFYIISRLCAEISCQCWFRVSNLDISQQRQSACNASDLRRFSKRSLKYHRASFRLKFVKRGQLPLADVS